MLFFRDPESTEEEELLENLVDVLASCLLLEENKSVFVEAEGERPLLGAAATAAGCLRRGAAWGTACAWLRGLKRGRGGAARLRVACHAPCAACIAHPSPATLSPRPANPGVELLLLILRGKRLARTSALKCLDFATTRCPPACDRVVDQAGLKTLFAIFMGKLKVRRCEDCIQRQSVIQTVHQPEQAVAGCLLARNGLGSHVRWNVGSERRGTGPGNSAHTACTPLHQTFSYLVVCAWQVPKKKRDEASTAGEEEERTVSVIASLLLNCSKQARVGGWGRRGPVPSDRC